MRVAALQIEAEVGDLDANLSACERHADAAARDGAEWIVLPEFFASGVGFLPALAREAPTPDGAPTVLLQDLAHRHGAHVGGSTLVRDTDGHVRNAFFLAGPDGLLRGRHDKDIPTMWENALYVGGRDPGIVDADGLSVGVALCWELMRTATARRLAGRVDMVVGGSGWWSVPRWRPHAVFDRLEAGNARRAVTAPSTFARHVGAPVVHAAHSGTLSCPMPWTATTYRGHFQGGATITDATGRLVAALHREQGPGHVVADIDPERTPPAALTDRFWLQPRGAFAALAWTYQGVHGRRGYRRSGAQQPTTTGVADDRPHPPARALGNDRTGRRCPLGVGLHRGHHPTRARRPDRRDEHRPTAPDRRSDMSESGSTPTVSMSRSIAAPPDRVFEEIVALLTGRPDGETFTGRWVGGAGPGPGARFRGWNGNGPLRWRTTSTITEYRPGSAVAFRVTSLGLAVADWRYDLDDAGGATTLVTESTWDRRGGLMNVLAPLATGVRDRATRNRRNIEATLAHLDASVRA